MSKMTQKDWDTIRNFSIKENWGDPFMIEKDLMVKLEALRMYVKKPIVIHCAYSTTGHSPHSQHGSGNACDINIKGLSVIEQFLVALRFDFRGYGLYGRDVWNNEGLHLDVRTTRQPAFWGCQRNQNGEKTYVLLNESFINHLSLLKLHS